ncbi:MAG: hypothetical protein AAGA99_19550 [Actinomycetota bacterium]
MVASVVEVVASVDPVSSAVVAGLSELDDVVSPSDVDVVALASIVLELDAGVVAVAVLGPPLLAVATSDPDDGPHPAATDAAIARAQTATRPDTTTRRSAGPIGVPPPPKHPAPEEHPGAALDTSAPWYGCATSRGG